MSKLLRKQTMQNHYPQTLSKLPLSTFPYIVLFHSTKPKFSIQNSSCISMFLHVVQLLLQLQYPKNSKAKHAASVLQQFSSTCISLHLIVIFNSTKPKFSCRRCFLRTSVLRIKTCQVMATERSCHPRVRIAYILDH